MDTDRDAQYEDLQHALERERERSRALREVGLMLDSRMPRDVLLERVLSCAARVTDAERATLYLMDASGERLVSHVTEGGNAGRIEVRVGEGIAGTAAGERRSVLAPDTYGDPRFQRAWDERTGFRTRSSIATPMCDSQGQLVGVVQVLNRKDGSFDREDVAMLEALAAQAAVAIEGARHMEALRQKNQTLTQLRVQLETTLRERNLRLAIEKLLARAEGVEEFLSGALEALAGAVGARQGALYLVDDAGSLKLRASWGCARDAAIANVPDRRAAVWTVAASGRAMALHGALAAEQVSALPGVAQSLLVTPLPGPTTNAGVLELRDHEESFGPGEVALAQRGAAGVATGLELLNGRRERTQANRFAAVGRALSTVVHDLRTPMSIISGYAQLMARLDSAEERAAKARAIVRQFDNVQAMIGELLAFVRGETQLLVSKVMVEQFFGEAVEVLRQEMAPRNVEVSLTVEGVGAARFDTVKITRLLHNLARNAADAMGSRGGHFKLTVRREADTLSLLCEDDGPGIPAAVRKRLFEAFVTEGKVGGTGLGLAIVKRIVEEHQGTLSVDTGSWGTRFTVRLPLMGPERERAAAVA